MPSSLNFFRLNVGFLINQSVGYSRDFVFDFPRASIKPDLELYDLTGLAHVTRTAQGLLVQAELNATLSTECVRCIEEFRQPLHAEFTELYAFSSKSVTDSGLVLPEDAHINLEPLVREYLLLDFPINPVCRLDCKGLCPVCGEDMNEVTCDHRPETSDPRLAVLKSLLDKE